MSHSLHEQSPSRAAPLCAAGSRPAISPAASSTDAGAASATGHRAPPSPVEADDDDRCPVCGGYGVVYDESHPLATSVEDRYLNGPPMTLPCPAGCEEPRRG